MKKEVYTPQEVAEIAGVTARTVRRWINEGRIKATKIGQWKISREELLKVLGKDPTE